VAWLEERLGSRGRHPLGPWPAVTIRARSSPTEPPRVWARKIPSRRI
jgi:hypothetical protein